MLLCVIVILCTLMIRFTIAQFVQKVTFLTSTGNALFRNLFCVISLTLNNMHGRLKSWPSFIRIA